jgi:hypothetical protein
MACDHILSYDWVNVLVIVVRYTGEQGLQSMRHDAGYI